jgi:riboflavin synthase
MFTGIIEALGTVEQATSQGANLLFTINSPISHELRIDQSVSHNGACLTVIGTEDNTHQVIAVAETLEKTNLQSMKEGSTFNLERSITLQHRLDGHIVQGHIDTVAICLQKKAKDGSVEFRFQFHQRFAHLIIEKGSIALNGISLTVYDVTLNEFSVAIIPYTFEHTTMKALQPGDAINVEFDLVGKYIHRLSEVNQLKG